LPEKIGCHRKEVTDMANKPTEAQIKGSHDGKAQGNYDSKGIGSVVGNILVGTTWDPPKDPKAAAEYREAYNKAHSDALRGK
jgi:hypothetical protein